MAQNETYVGLRLLFQRAGNVETDLMDVISGSEAKRILRRTFGGALIILLITYFAGPLAGLSGSGADEQGSGTTTFGSLLTFLWIAWHLFMPRTEILSDWHLLLDGKAWISDTAYGVVFVSLRQDHAIPATIEPRRMRVGPPVRGMRNLLRVRIGKYLAYISVFPFGNDLFLGWTLWRRQIPIMIVFRWIAAFLGGDPGFSGIIDVEPIKAMREAVHNALRRGIEAAMIGRQIPIAQSFGYELPIETVSHPGVPQETPAAPPTRPSMLTVIRRVEVFSANGTASIGFAEPGLTYEFLGEDTAGLVVRDGHGAVMVIREKAAVRSA